MDERTRARGKKCSRRARARALAQRVVGGFDALQAAQVEHDAFAHLRANELATGPARVAALKEEVERAFGESIAVIWRVMVGLIGVGLLASLIMQDVPLHDLTDERWALQEGKDEPHVEELSHSR